MIVGVLTYMCIERPLHDALKRLWAGKSRDRARAAQAMSAVS
jgi:hypothetical protein